MNDSSANSRQVGGQHYASEYQHWDFVDDVLNGMYLEGVISKYITRWRKKNGREDLLKADHYLDKLIETNEAYLAHGGSASSNKKWDPDYTRVEEFRFANDLGHTECQILLILSGWATTEDLQRAKALLQELIATA